MSFNPQLPRMAYLQNQNTLLSQMASYSKYQIPFQSPLLQSQLPLSNRMPMIMTVPINPLMMNPLQKQTNDNKKVWVGKIPEGVSDTFMLRLLETCGTVVSWKRVTDSKGKQNTGTHSNRGNE